jgi:hypothetical protein
MATTTTSSPGVAAHPLGALEGSLRLPHCLWAGIRGCSAVQLSSQISDRRQGGRLGFRGLCTSRGTLSAPHLVSQTFFTVTLSGSRDPAGRRVHGLHQVGAAKKTGLCFDSIHG